jgi:hypothetical protein
MCIDPLPLVGGLVSPGPRDAGRRWATNNEVGWSGMDVSGRGPAVRRCGDARGRRSWSPGGAGMPARFAVCQLRQPEVATPASILRQPIGSLPPASHPVTGARGYAAEPVLGRLRQAGSR